MTFPMTVFAAAVFLLGIPAAFRSRTAGALVVAYLAVQGLWMATGAVLPSLLLFWIDVACIAAICTRPPVKSCYPASPLALCVLWLERSKADRFVLACFPVAWGFYAFAAADWWSLYWVSLAQLLAASAEGLATYFTRRGPSAALTDEDERPPGGVEFALAGRYRGGG